MCFYFFYLWSHEKQQSIKNPSAAHRKYFHPIPSHPISSRPFCIELNALAPMHLLPALPASPPCLTSESSNPTCFPSNPQRRKQHDAMLGWHEQKRKNRKKEKERKEGWKKTKNMKCVKCILKKEQKTKWAKCVAQNPSPLVTAVLDLYRLKPYKSRTVTCIAFSSSLSVLSPTHSFYPNICCFRPSSEMTSLCTSFSKSLCLDGEKKSERFVLNCD